MQIRDTPHAIAGGLALGILLGLMPLLIPFVPAKTLLALLLAWLFRCSKLAAIIGVNCHDILLPIWPLILRWQFIIGYWLLSSPHRLPPKLPSIRKQFGGVDEHVSIGVWLHRWEQHWLHWKTIKLVWWPMFLGSVVMALPLALLVYMIALQIVTRSQQKAARHAATPVV